MPSLSGSTNPRRPPVTASPRSPSPGAVDSSSPPPLQLLAASPGTWGNRLRASIDTTGITDITSAQFASSGLTRADLFNLTIEFLDEDNRALVSERYLNVSTKPTAEGHSLAHALASGSALCRVAVSPSDPTPNGSAATGTRGHDGDPLSEATYLGDRAQRTGLYRLEQVDVLNLLCIPPDRGLDPKASPEQQDLPSAIHLAAATYCTDRRALYLVDPPLHWEALASAGRFAEINPDDLGIHGQNEAGIEVARNAAVYFPRYFAADPHGGNQLCAFSPSGMVAGVIAATDLARGIWKAPAGPDARLAGVDHLAVTINDEQDGMLNARGINCLRQLPAGGPVIWGARTLRGADAFQDDYKYLPVRRLVLFIEDSLYRLTRWAVFEPNDESLWSALRLCVDQFLANLARQGACYNYSVACGLGTTMTATDILNGTVSVRVAVAPTKPTEFLLILIGQQVLPPA